MNKKLSEHNYSDFTDMGCWAGNCTTQATIQGITPGMSALLEYLAAATLSNGYPRSRESLAGAPAALDFW